MTLVERRPADRNDRQRRRPGPERRRWSGRKFGYGRLCQPLKFTIGHPYGVVMRTGTETDFRIFSQPLVDEHPLAVERAEWRHRAGLAVAVKALELRLPGQSNRSRLKR